MFSKILKTPFRSEYSCFNHDFCGYFVFFNAVLKGKPPVLIFCVFSVTSIVKCKMSQKNVFLSENEHLLYFTCVSSC